MIRLRHSLPSKLASCIANGLYCHLSTGISGNKKSPDQTAQTSTPFLANLAIFFDRPALITLIASDSTEKWI